MSLSLSPLLTYDPVPRRAGVERFDGVTSVGELGSPAGSICIFLSLSLSFSFFLPFLLSLLPRVGLNETSVQDASSWRDSRPFSRPTLVSPPPDLAFTDPSLVTLQKRSSFRT